MVVTEVMVPLGLADEVGRAHQDDKRIAQRGLGKDAEIQQPGRNDIGVDHGFGIPGLLGQGRHALIDAPVRREDHYRLFAEGCAVPLGLDQGAVERIVHGGEHPVPFANEAILVPDPEEAVKSK